MENNDLRYAKWLNGEISDAELQALEGSEALMELKKVVQTMDNWTMPSYDTTKGYEKFREGQQTSPTRVRKLNRFALSGIAASFLIITFVGSKYLLNQGEVLQAYYGQTEHLAMEDGSEIWLNDGSSIAYNSADWSTERTIELTGEATFEVSKGSPFTVNTPNGTITVLGTQFNVRAWGSNLYVECYEGKVQVVSGDQATVLTAQEGVNIIGGSMEAKQGINNTSPTWQSGTSRFYNDNLRIVCDELERQYQIKVELRSQDRNFSGNFTHVDLDQALRSICRPLGLSYTISQDENTVVIE